MSIGQWFVARLAVFCVLAGAGLIISVSSASAEWEIKEDFGPDGSTASSFAEASSVAADTESGVIYVLDAAAGALYKFDLEGKPVDFGGSAPYISGNKLSGLVTGEGGPGERQVAVSPVTHDVYVPGLTEGGKPKVLQAFKGNGEPSVFSGTGNNMITGFAFLRGIAVDETGAIYTADGGLGGAGAQVYAKSGTLIVSGAGESNLAVPASLAVDSQGVLYAERNSTDPVKFIPSEYPVTFATVYSVASEFVNPDEAHGLAVDRDTDNLYVSEFSPTPRIAVFNSESESAGQFGGPGESGELKAPQGLAAITNEGEARVYVADKVGGESRVKVFIEKICDCPPAIESTSVSDVTGDSATLRAKIYPFNQPTTYWFEYGPEDCKVGPCEKVPSEGGKIAPGKKGVPVQFALTRLSPGTTYHFRVVAENETGAEPGSDRTFTTQSSGLGAALADSRAWEMVSPAEKVGGVVFVNNSTAIQAASSGDKLDYASIGSLFDDPVSNRVPEPASLVATRDPSGSWTSRELTPPHHETSTFVHGQTEFKLFTPDLAHSVMEPSEDNPLSAEATERTPYLWDDGAPPLFTPLLTPANVPPGTVLDPAESQPNRVRIAGAAPDLSVIALKSIPSLLPGAQTESIYAWSNGTLEAISELPASEGGAVVRGSVGTGEGSVRHAISDDGSRVFWTASEGSLYLRDRSAGQSVRLDVKKAGASGTGANRPAFAGASADGGVAYFTDSQRLTANSSPAGRDLYRCQIGDVGGGALGCATLTDLSAPIPGSGESAEVIDQLPAISNDGTRLFFVAKGVLDEEANEEGENAKTGEHNLYYRAEGASPRFVGTLSEKDRLVWGQKLAKGGAVNTAVLTSAAISPNGRYLAFTSEKSLTGYENTNAEGHPTTEAFVYDTEASAERLSCISCNPSGAIAVGEQLPEGLRNFPPDSGGLWGGRWASATLPEATQTESGGPSLYRPRAVLNNGRVFLNSVDPLVGADSNGEWDVYQYEPLGVGSCEAGSGGATVARSGAGCVALLSSGSAEGDAGFLDASESGEDAFFLTSTRLSVLDRDEELDVYDARVNGIPAVLHPVSECAGEACQPSVGPPSDPTPASESFKGAETPLTCRKGQKKVKKQGRAVCVNKKKHHKHKKHHKKKKAKKG